MRRLSQRQAAFLYRPKALALIDFMFFTCSHLLLMAAARPFWRLVAKAETVVKKRSNCVNFLKIPPFFKGGSR